MKTQANELYTAVRLELKNLWVGVEENQKRQKYHNLNWQNLELPMQETCSPDTTRTHTSTNHGFLDGAIIFTEHVVLAPGTRSGGNE